MCFTRSSLLLLCCYTAMVVYAMCVYTMDEATLNAAAAAFTKAAANAFELADLPPPRFKYCYRQTAKRGTAQAFRYMLGIKM